MPKLTWVQVWVGRRKSIVEHSKGGDGQITGGHCRNVVPECSRTDKPLSMRRIPANDEPG
jgi:hypothetical protein